MKRTLFFLLAFAAILSAAETRFVLPILKATPTIDGLLDDSPCLTVQGIVQYNSLYLSGRQGTIRFALTPDSFYVAATTQLPPDGVPLLDRVKKNNGAVFLDDSVEIDLTPPNATAVYQVIVNPSGAMSTRKYPIDNGGTTHTHFLPWEHSITTASTCESGIWTMEMAIPLKDMENPASAPGAIWGFLAGRNWQQPSEQTTTCKVTYFTAPDTMAKAVVNPSLPVVSQLSIGAEAANGKYDLHLTAHNFDIKPHKIQLQCDAVSDAAPRQIDKEFTVAANSSIPLHFEFDNGTKSVTEFRASVKDLDSGTIIFQRNFTHDPNLVAKWNDPNQKKDVQLDFGFYPYYRLLRARFGSPAEPTSGWAKATFQATTEDGKELATLPGVSTPWGFEAEFKEFEPPVGKHKITVKLFGKDGATFEHSRNFVRNTFPWEGNDIGKERVVIPPYIPLKKEGDRTISGLLTSYSFRDGFFSEVTADGKALLAAPVTLAIDGEILREQKFQFTEIAEDRVCTEAILTWKGGKVVVKGTLDYDGFYRFILDFQPNGRIELNSAVLSIPLRREFASQIHSTCNKLRYNDAKELPEGDGLIWRSSQSQKTPKHQGSFRPYLWLGKLAHGMAWCAQTDQHWSIPENGDAIDIMADKNTATLRINIVGQPTVWEKPFKLEQALQASPTRPRPANRRHFLERTAYPNSWTVCTLAGASCWGCYNVASFRPADGDYAYINYLSKRQFSTESNKAMIDEFMSHAANFPEHRKASFRNHLERGIYYSKISRWNVPYINARCAHLDVPDYQTFMDEWWCSEYRAENADEYNTTPTASFRDMALFYLRRLVREGMDGIYYDNVRDWTNPNPVTGPAYRLKDNTIQPYFDIFEQRELLKRTATMLYKEGKTLPDGRPILIAHMTNTNILPYTSFATITLDMEAEYGSRDFQDRFTEGYIQTCTLGLQSGAIPEILVQISGNNTDFVTRTFLAVTLAYDLPFVMNCGGVTPTWSKVWRKLFEWGYPTFDVKVTACYENPQVSSDVAQWRFNTMVKGNEAVVCVSNFGDAAEGSIDLTRLGFKPTAVTDFESGKAVPLDNGNVTLQISKHDFRIINVKR